MTTTNNYSDVWVCSDCMLADHGYDDHLDEGGTVTATGLEPFGLWRQGHVLTDNTCSNHNGDDETPCEHCGQLGYENGIDDFSSRQCSGCGSRLAGARYRYAAHD